MLDVVEEGRKWLLLCSARRWSVGGEGRRQEAKNNELDTFFHLKFCCLSLLVKKSRAKKGSHPDLICISLSAFRFPYTLLQYQQNPSSRYVNKQHVNSAPFNHKNLLTEFD